MKQPLVSVICVCYNQAQFVTEALDSVMHQTYPLVELIIIDDGSTDGSGKVIKQWLAGYPEATLILNGRNIGYCKTFNKAYRICKGEFIIDLSADDILLPDRIASGVHVLAQAGNYYGVAFSDAEYVDEQGSRVGLHSDQFPHETVPQGEIYTQVIQRYFICSPTMMIRRAVLDTLQGYDEALAFEDFDFWIRASRLFKFIYSPEVLVKKRNVSSSMSAKQFARSSPQRWSTLEVCRKIKSLNKTDDENQALKQRLRYEIGVSLRSFDFALAYSFWKLLRSV
jgi:glycosyltransferase involved in cell wall biosynthesis